MNWDYLQPVKIHFGKGRVKESQRAWLRKRPSGGRTVFL